MVAKISVRLSVIVRKAAFRAKLRDLELTQVSLARALDFSERQIRRYAAGAPVPHVVTMAMRQVYYVNNGGRDARW